MLNPSAENSSAPAGCVALVSSTAPSTATSTASNTVQPATLARQLAPTQQDLKLRSTLAANERLIEALREPLWLLALMALPRLVTCWYTRWQQRQQLLDLSDHLLRDLGLSPSDARLEGRKPFWIP